MKGTIEVSRQNFKHFSLQIFRNNGLIMQSLLNHGPHTSMVLNFIVVPQKKTFCGTFFLTLMHAVWVSFSSFFLSYFWQLAYHKLLQLISNLWRGLSNASLSKKTLQTINSSIDFEYFDLRTEQNLSANWLGNWFKGCSLQRLSWSQWLCIALPGAFQSRSHSDCSILA